MGLRDIVRGVVVEHLNEVGVSKEVWFHGTPDAREVEKEAGFHTGLRKLNM